MSTADNGWPAPPKEPIHPWVLGGFDRTLSLLDNYAGFVLAHLADWYNDHIEPLNPGADDWGGAPVKNIPGSNVASNHSAYLAIDLNAQRNPQYRHDYTTAQRNLIRERLYWYDRVSLGYSDVPAPSGWDSNSNAAIVRAGMDYHRAPEDDMHFEYNRSMAGFVRGQRLALHLLKTPRGKELVKLNRASGFIRRRT